jgi:hypothetical protein
MTAISRTSHTARLLLRLRRALLLSTIAVIVTSFAVWNGVQDAAATVRDRTSPAILAVTSAKTALIKADQSAVRSFDSGVVMLAGPGDDYQNQTALASQNLARAAELSAAGDTASRYLQVVEALLTEYTAAIEQADAHYRQPGGSVLGIADLWNASRLLHSDLDGVLVRLDDLGRTQQDALTTQLSQNWMDPRTSALWLAPMGLLLALLVRTQWTLAKRFRRRFNPPLAVATALLAAVIAGMAWTFVVHHDLQDTRATLERVVDERNTQAREDDVAQQQELQAMLASECGQGGGCGPTVTNFHPAEAPGSVPTDQQIAADIAQAGRSAAAAAAAGWLQITLPLAGVAIGALIGWGLRDRIDEYRYRA